MTCESYGFEIPKLAVRLLMQSEITSGSLRWEDWVKKLLSQWDCWFPLWQGPVLQCSQTRDLWENQHQKSSFQLKCVSITKEKIFLGFSLQSYLDDDTLCKWLKQDQELWDRASGRFALELLLSSLWAVWFQKGCFISSNPCSFSSLEKQEIIPTSLGCVSKS